MGFVKIPGSNIESTVGLNIDGKEVQLGIEIGKRNSESEDPDPYGDFQGICEKCSCWVSVRETAIWDEFGLCVEHVDCSNKIYDF